MFLTARRKLCILYTETVTEGYEMNSLKLPSGSVVGTVPRS